MKKERIAYWDNVKAILIFLVVIGHAIHWGNISALEPLMFMIYSFHMPVFFFVAGLFHKNERIMQGVCSYLIIGYLYKIIVQVYRLLDGKKNNFSFISEGGAPWFVFAIAAFTVLSFLFRNVKKKYLLLLICVLCSLAAGYCRQIGDVFLLSRIIVFYPFYLLGNIISRDKVLECLTNKKVRWCGAVVLILFGIISIYLKDVEIGEVFLYLFKGRYAYSRISVDCNAIHRMLYYILVVVVGGSFMSIMPKRQVWFSKIGRNTLQIYFWHYPILRALMVAWKKYDLGYSIAECTLLIFLCCVMTVVLSAKCFAFPTKQIMNIKKR